MSRFSSGNGSPRHFNAERARREMVERQLRIRGVTDPRILAAMGEIPREEFVPESLRTQAYCDEPLAIGFGQTISQPYIAALMVQTLELQGSELVLEVGTGSGYHAAILGKLAREVVTVELVPELVEQARANLERTGLSSNVKVQCGDGSMGLPELAPFDAISVAAAAPDVPQALLDQLNDPGRLVIPIGSRDDQELYVFSKSCGKTRSYVAALCRFVPLLGARGWR